MWMASQFQSGQGRERAAEVGQVTLAGEVGVALAGERRGLPVCGPGGYRWTPKAGDAVLVVKTGAEEAPCVVGAVSEAGEPGEITISAVDGAGITLKADGTVHLFGQVFINGEEVL